MSATNHGGWYESDEQVMARLAKRNALHAERMKQQAEQEAAEQITMQQDVEHVEG